MSNKSVVPDDLEQLAKPLLDSAGSVGVAMIEAELVSFSEGCFVLLDPAAMAAAISLDRPALIFYSQHHFDARTTISIEIINAGGRETSLNRKNALMPTINECLEVLPEAFKSREGFVHRLRYAYSAHGLARLCVLDGDWYDELTDYLGEFIEGHQDRFEAQVAADAAKLESVFEALAIEIADDERFVKARGLRKKGLLVESVWGDRIPKDEQSRVTRLAQGEDPQDWNFVHLVRQASDIVEKRQFTQSD